MSAIPKVSVIIPVYNSEEFLEQCLESLVNQTFKDIEIICVDDGSTDRSAEIISRFRSGCENIVLLEQANSGAGAARNKGLDNARGEYLLFLDADDFFESDMLEKVYNSATMYSSDAVLFAGVAYDQITKAVSAMHWLLKDELLPSTQPFSALDVKEKLFQLTSPSPWTKMWRRSFIEESGLRFQDLHNANDLYFIYMALALADRISYVNEVFTHYRRSVKDSLQAKKSEHPYDFHSALLSFKIELKKGGFFPTLPTAISTWRRASANTTLQEVTGTHSRQANECLYTAVSDLIPPSRLQNRGPVPPRAAGRMPQRFR